MSATNNYVTVRRISVGDLVRPLKTGGLTWRADDGLIEIVHPAIVIGLLAGHADGDCVTLLGVGGKIGRYNAKTLMPMCIGYAREIEHQTKCPDVDAGLSDR